MLSELFLASLFILFGLSMLLSTLFGINIPLFRIVAAVFLVYIGITKIVNWPASKEHTIYFGKKTMVVDKARLKKKKPNEFAVIFATSEIDLSKIEHISPDESPIEIKINTIFGNTDIKLNDELTTKIIGETAFGKTEYPDGTNINFGKYSMQTKEAEKADIILQTSTSFGKLDIKDNK